MVTISQAARAAPAKRIAIYGNVGTLNLGDEATIAAVIQNIRLRAPTADLFAFVLYPQDTKERHGLRAYPIRSGSAFLGQVGQDHPDDPRRSGTIFSGLRSRARSSLRRLPWLFSFLKVVRSCSELIVGLFQELAFFIRSMPRLAGCDLFIVAGSGQLLDHLGGTWQYPYTCFKWVCAARLMGAKVVFVSVGVSHISSPLSKLFFKRSLSLAKYRSFRDHTSKRQIEQLGVGGENRVSPDLVFSLSIPEKLLSSRKARVRTVGINVIPYFDDRFWPDSDAAVYKKYAENMASFALWLLETSHDIVFFPTQLRMDPPAIHDIRQIIQRESGSQYIHRVTECSIHTVEDLVDQIATTDIVVAARFHGVLISYLLNKPVLGISYHTKTEELMTEMGQAEHVLDISRCDLDSLIRLFTSLESSAADVKQEQEIERRVHEHRLALDDQYGRVLGLLGQEALAESPEIVERSRYTTS